MAPSSIPTESMAPSVSAAPSISSVAQTASMAPSVSYTPTMSPVSGNIPTTPTIAARTLAPVLPPQPIRSAAPVGGEVPTPAPPTFSEGDNDAAKNFGWVVFAGVFVIAMFAACRCYAVCRRRRDQRMMDLRSAQADRVLGDMQMIPSEDEDHDLL
jgi:hypothetical protein